MSPELHSLNEKVDRALERVQKLEERLEGASETAPWRYLVARPHPWRRQLCIKGRNMTVGQLISTIRGNQLSEFQAAEDLDLPLDAIRESVRYYEANRELIQLEAAEERRRLTASGYATEPLSR